MLGGLFVVAGGAVAYGDTGYPFLSAAFAALLGLSALAALVLAVPLAFRPASRAAMFAIGLTFFLDVAYIGSGPVTNAAIVLLAGYLVYLIAWRKSATVVPFATTAVAVSVAFILPQQALTNTRLTPARIELATAGPGAKGRPFVHIILDEMGSLGMMPKGPYYDGLRERMIADYRKRGFDLFEDTAASAGITALSLGQIFAGYHGEMHGLSNSQGAFSYSIGENRTADRFENAGYRITMLQNSYVRICDSDRWRCLTYARGGDGSALMRRAISDADGVSYALRTTNSLLLLDDSSRSSLYYKAVGRIMAFFGAAVPSWRLYYARPPQTIDLMETAARALRTLDSGEAVFLHLLVPHFPYLLDKNCRVKAPRQARAPGWVMRHLGIEADAAATERAYWEQAACVHQRLMAMIDAILQSPGGKEAVILVHGDHGSRLLKKLVDPSKETASELERRSALLAHFAVRGVESRHAELVMHHDLRERVSTVLNAVLDGDHPDHGLVTSATP